MCSSDLAKGKSAKGAATSDELADTTLDADDTDADEAEKAEEA